jgi:hypothetical protein
MPLRLAYGPRELRSQCSYRSGYALARKSSIAKGSVIHPPSKQQTIVSLCASFCRLCDSASSSKLAVKVSRRVSVLRSRHLDLLKWSAESGERGLAQTLCSAGKAIVCSKYIELRSSFFLNYRGVNPSVGEVR